MSGMTDEELLDQFRGRGIEDAWNELYERHADRLYRYLYYRVGMREADAKDLFQETVMTAIDRLSTCREAFYPWLQGIARHKIQHHYRSVKRRGQWEDRMADAEQAMTVWLKALDTQPLPDALLAQKETGQLIGAAMSLLPPHYQDGLKKKYLHGQSLEDIAGELHLSAQAVGQLLYRAREAFKKALALLAQGEIAHES